METFKGWLYVGLQIAFTGVILFCVGALVYAVVADLFGWYDKPKGE